jgi:hypothetical protein
MRLKANAASAVSVERPCHELRVSDADTEARPTSPERVQKHFVNLVQDQPRADVVPCVDTPRRPGLMRSRWAYSKSFPRHERMWLSAIYIQL